MTDDRIQNEAEVLRWYDAGCAYQWMSEEYERRYNLEVAPGIWAAFCRRRCLTPWVVDHRHRWAYALKMLRLEAQLRAGAELEAWDLEQLGQWCANLAEGDLVIHYDANDEDGFSYVPRRPGIDTDLYRVPDHPPR